jgi:predicted  nucleic acid-binding Zn-ribbon protein
MTKPLLIACIVLSVGAAALGFLNRGKLSEAVSATQNSESQLNTARQELQATKSQLDSKTQELASLTSAKETSSSELTAAREEVAKAKEDFAAAQEKVTAAEAEVTQLKADGEAKDTRIAELEQQAVAPAAETATPAGPEVGELQARLTELETVNQQLQDQNTGLTTQITELRRKEDGRQKGLMRPGISGTILAVNQAWNFVVLSLGDRQGVVPNAEMLVQRDGRFLGRIRVTSVEPSTSIADILVRTVPRGFTIMPGDRVVYASTGD